jgi:hypothetical protein
MRGWLGGAVLWQIFRTIAQRAQPDARVEAVVEFRIAGRRDGGINRYQITLIKGRAMASRGGGPGPALTLLRAQRPALVVTRASGANGPATPASWTWPPQRRTRSLRRGAGSTASFGQTPV